jgi:mannitol-1-/sugar-/sorbitol-6-phosphatase
VIALVVLAGAAGTGKTTVGRRLARCLGAALLDLDTVTGPLVELLLEREDYGSTYERTIVRPARYRALTALALDVLAGGVPVVAAAPWTKELTDRAWFDDLARSAQDLGGQLVVVWLSCDPEIRRRRLAARGLARDAAVLRQPLQATPTPLVPHVAVDTNPNPPA